MLWTLRLEDGQYFLLGDGAEVSRRPRERILADGKVLEADGAYSARKFLDWAARYDRDVRMDVGERSVALTPLLAIGREIADWLDEHQWVPKLLGGAGDIQLDIQAGEGSPDQVRAFLNVPWELLATGVGFLAEDPVRLFCVQRRMERATAPLKPKHQRLALMFMAASPMDAQPVLDFEAEEAAILRATDQLAVALTVEESGCLEFLQPRLANEGPFEALHLSCHGDIGKDGQSFSSKIRRAASRSPPPPTSSRPSAPTSRAWCSSPPAAPPNMKRKARRSRWSCSAPACPPCSVGTVR